MIVRASDDGTPPLIGELAVTVTVTPVDEPPAIDRPGERRGLPGEQPHDQGRRQLQGRRPGGRGRHLVGPLGERRGQVRVQQHRRADVQGLPELRAATGVRGHAQRLRRRFHGEPDRDRDHRGRERAADGRAAQGTGPFSIVENSGTEVGRFDATDPERRDVTWSLARTHDHARFEIDANDGALSFKAAPDYESSDIGSDKAYNVTVQATEVDGGNPLTGSLAVTVAVTDVNEPPTVSGERTPSVDENTTAVATYRATDPDERATITWSVEDPGASDFTITNAGALSFASAPNYEVKSSYTVTVRASDGTNDVDHDVTVTVTDVTSGRCSCSPTGHRSLAKSSPLRSKKGRATTWITCSRQPGRGRARPARPPASRRSAAPPRQRISRPATTANATCV